MLEYQNTETFLLTDTLQIGLEMYLRLQMSKILLRGHMLLVILLEQDVGTFLTFLEGIKPYDCFDRMLKLN